MGSSDRDCIEDLRFYPIQSSQGVIERAMSIRSGKAELLNVQIDVEPTGFNKGFYSVDIRYFYKITAEAFVGAARPIEVTGLAIFDKRVILFGGEGGAKVFSSEYALDEVDEQTLSRTNSPVAMVEVVDPLVLGMKLVDPVDCFNPCNPCNPCCPPNPFPPCPPNPFPPCPPPGPFPPIQPFGGDPHMTGCSCNNDCCEVPPHICNCFGCDLSFSNDKKRLYITLGQFSIIRLERDSQLLIPVYDYCLPTKECVGSAGVEDPCDLFRQVQFPMDDFFPPSLTPHRPGDSNCHCRFC